MGVVQALPARGYRALRSPDDAPALQDNRASRYGRYALGIQDVFGYLNPLVQCLRGVIVQHGHSLLADNRPGIHTCVDEMHRAARHLDAVRQRLLPCRQARKGRQQ